jgi:hypothetical protein
MRCAQHLRVQLHLTTNPEHVSTYSLMAFLSADNGQVRVIVVVVLDAVHVCFVNV